MLATSILLGLVAVALAWPVPILLARSRWPLRAPGSALFAWQTVAFAGGISMIGALAIFGLAPFGQTALKAGAGAAAWLGRTDGTTRVSVASVVALSVALLLALHLLLTLAVTWTHTGRLRRRHRALVALLGKTTPGDPRTRVLDVAAPVAYCLPGGASMTVLSTGLVESLGHAELEAVIAHERGHALQRHHLVLVTFRAWHRALPWLPTARLAEEAVTRLVELLADDYARHRVEDGVLRRAILQVTPTGSLGLDEAGAPVDGSLTLLRAQRLSSGSTGLRLPYRLLVASASAALLCIPPALIVLRA
ncbi:MAG TPA: M56 family metallopeptidase [Microbacteriaceae bacterium]|nr:M56 family metallopeptidase [Microbacteriaceae bacterium]